MKRPLNLVIMFGAALALMVGIVGCTGGQEPDQSHTEGNSVKANSAPSGATAHGVQTTAPSGGGGGAQTQSTAPTKD
jgi:hypothetical protein